MLTLNDGRSELWQWDTGRALAVDADCSQVHFSNKVFGRSIDVDVVDGAAIIPDILLQTDKDLNVWAFVGTADNGYTKISKTFKVNRRNKPADYVFTQTDQITLQTIQNQIGDLADLTTEEKDTLVAAINEAARTGGGAGSMDLRVADGYVQYSTDGGMTWTNLIAMEDLKGADGITPTIGPNGNWYLGEEDTGNPSRGATGAPGKDGADGAPGKDGAGMDVTGATVGQIAKIAAVDASGTPTAWAPVDMPSGMSEWQLITDTTIAEEDASTTLFVSQNDSGESFLCHELLIVWIGIAVTDGTESGKAWISLNPDKAGYNSGKCGLMTSAYFYYTSKANYMKTMHVESLPYKVEYLDTGVSTSDSIDAQVIWQNGISSVEVSAYGRKSFYGRVIIYGR